MTELMADYLAIARRRRAEPNKHAARLRSAMRIGREAPRRLLLRGAGAAHRQSHPMDLDAGG